MKVVTKVIANRLKSLWLSWLLEPRVALFQGGKQRKKILLLKRFHSMRCQKGIRSLMVIKINLEKAYDRIKWDFLEQVLQQVDFEEHLIMNLGFTFYSMEWWKAWGIQTNERYKASRLIVSLLVCVEVLSNYINTIVEIGEWQGIHLSLTGLLLSHVCFADDLLLFSVAPEKQAMVMEWTLELFVNFSDNR